MGHLLPGEAPDPDFLEHPYDIGPISPGMVVLPPELIPPPLVIPPGSVGAAPAPLPPMLPRPVALVPQPSLQDPIIRQAGIPIIGGAIALGMWLVRLAPQIARAAARFRWSIPKTITFIRAQFWRTFKIGGLVASGVWLADFLNLDSNEMAELAGELLAEGEKKKRKRYSIGSNPRVGTLAKVARHTMRLLKRHQKVIKQFFPQTSRRGELASRERAHHRLIGKAID